MSLADDIRRKLALALAPAELTVEDESHRHVGHAGARPGGETHLRVRIVSPAFEGMSRLERQRRIYGLLAEEMRAQIHALSLDARTPGE